MNRRKGRLLLMTAMTITGVTAGCAKGAAIRNPIILESNENTEAVVLKPDEETAFTINPGTEIMELEEGFQL